ncbi:MAG: phosphoadenosine phosphosulfate reductase family protein [Moritella sp.]|uniref:phosphoadenosine phosphosulfate reductase domain-containing protein n=1 Tax=Moritella sp. TaxID=78556 RepID=UPI001D62B7F6|nr:phosphoadenosine phosphosulfate reductase family protein [Moritella sp.]NQZ48694.1 phosphoadenosine phosphosulfate reductase family protein [Moritella sp.]
MNIFDLGTIKSELANEAYLLSEILIAEYITLLHQGYCFQVGFSSGKDSSCVTNAAVEAMHRCIADGTISTDHPLVIINIDTLLDAESTQTYAPWVIMKLKAYCASLNINLQMKVVSPPLQDQLMILYAGAQKLPATASSGRSMDCSIIWKIDTGIRALRNIKATLPKQYREATWISISGSRHDESTRRSHNMLRQGVRSVKAQTLIDNINADSSKKAGKVYKFAPISDWSAPDVFNYLNHAGDKPVINTLVGQRIAAYDNNFGLLVAIYGEGTSDVCEVVAIDSENKAEQNQCGKVARFGCVTCGAVNTDTSSIELKKYPRWARFGDSTLRFRDFLQRISSDMDHRAFHARAYDPMTNNNVFLQPNVLRAKTLEKMVWFAAQITIDSRDTHSEFVKSYNAGTIDADVGVVDIMSDETLSENVKLQYKEMYVNRLLQKPMFEMFTEKHAILLSLLWGLHGVSALPYRPVAILEQVKNGKRIPFPLTNTEMNKQRALKGLLPWDDKSVLNNVVPDAFVAQLFQPAKQSFTALKQTHGHQLNETHLQQFLPFTLCDHWQKQDVQFDALGGVILQSMSKAKHTRTFKLSYEINTRTNSEIIKAKDAATNKKIDLSNNQPLHDELMVLGRNDFYTYLESKATSAMSVADIMEIQKEEKTTFGVTSVHAFNNQQIFISDVRSFGALRKKVEPGKHFSARKRSYDKKTEKHTAERASLRVYNASPTPGLEEQAVQTVQYWLPDFAMTRHCAIDIHRTQDLNAEQIKNSFVFDDVVFNDWLAQDGWNKLLALHNASLSSSRKTGLSMRTYKGTDPVYYLTNNTGLTATPQFEPYLLKTLKRTEIYFTAGLFNLANKSISEIENTPNVISMTAHRAQKVQHLLAVRYLRNQRRRLVKSQIALSKQNPSANCRQSIENVNVRLTEFINQYKQVAKAYVAAAMFSPICHGNDARSRQVKIDVWLLEFSHVVGSVDGMLSTLATKNEMLAINDDYDSKQALTRSFTVSIKELHSEIEAFTAVPKKMLNELSTTITNQVGSVLIHRGQVQTISVVSDQVDVLANWIASNHERVNSFLVGYGLTKRLSYVKKLHYVCEVFGDRPESNTLDKIEKRYVEAIKGWEQSAEALNLSGHTCFVSFISTAVNSTATQQRRSLSNVSLEAKTSKLNSLMAGQLALIAKPRTPQHNLAKAS